MPEPVRQKKTLFDFIKQHIIALGSVATIVSAIVGGVIAVESRYVKAADLQNFKEEQQKTNSYLIYQQQRSIEDLRLNGLEDKIFELEQKPTRTPTDNAVLQRLLRQREDITNTRRGIVAPPPPPGVITTPSAISPSR